MFLWRLIVSLMTQWFFHRGVGEQTKAFMTGFNEVLPLQWLQYFDEREFEVSVVFPVTCFYMQLFQSRIRILYSVPAFFIALKMLLFSQQVLVMAMNCLSVFTNVGMLEQHLFVLYYVLILESMLVV